MGRLILAFVLLSVLACSSQPGAEDGGAEGAVSENRASLDTCTGPFGTEGDDVICGSGGNDVLSGGPGDDVLYGYIGSDTYVFGRGDDLDRAVDGGVFETDRVLLNDLAPGDVLLERRGNSPDLTLVVTPGVDEIALADFYGGASHAYGVEEVQFPDGTVWDRAYLLAHANQVGTEGDDTLNASAADDRIFGKEGDDVLSGSLGNDILIGGPGRDNMNGDQGSDTFLFARGDGLDRVLDYSVFETDRVRLSDVGPGEVELERRGNSVDFTIVVSPGVDEVSLGEFYASYAHAYGVEEVEFSDGTVWDRVYLLAHANQVGTEGDDTLNSSAADDRIFGREGNDVLSGSLGNDVLSGGPGSDSMNGDQGSDTFVFARGDGLDRVLDYSVFETDRVRLSDVAPGEVELERRGNSIDLTIVVSPGVDEIALGEFYASYAHAYGVEELEFSDGTVWDRAFLLAHANQVGTEGDDTLNGSAADDRIFGKAGDDVLFGSIGHDVLIGGPGSDQLNGDQGSDTFLFARGDGLDRLSDGSVFETDRVRLTDVAPGEVQLERRNNGLHLTIVVNRGADEIELTDFYGGASHAYGIEEVEFADGTVWNRAYLLAHASPVGG